MRQSIINALVREVDPVTDDEVVRWRGAVTTAAIRARAVLSAEPASLDAARIGRRSRGPSIALAAAILVVIGAGAGAAAIVLGKPAPREVREDLGAVDSGFPADLRFNPDVATARSVATTGPSTLYYARLKDGGHCTEIATSGVPRGAVCTTAARMRLQPIEITIPFTDPVTSDSPVTIGGHVNAPGIASVAIRYGDGSTDPIAFGDEGFFIFDVPAGHVGSVHASDFTIVGLNDDGQEVVKAEVPAIEEEPAGPIQDHAPITVDTVSDGSDFTRVLGVRGRVNAEGAVSLEFRYPDGTTVAISLEDDGSYAFDIPTARQADLFHAPGTLTARDDRGHEVASVPVAAVAFWRGSQDGPEG